jgi:serine/threonine protein kinase
MADLSHHHLLKCLASFVFSSKYHMIYEKADCNIEVFMRKNPNPRSLANLTTDDLAQQLFGLADALCFIHNQGSPDSTPSTNLLGVPQVSARKTGYIHDIKPENLLMFIYNQPGKKSYWIRLSDFSCAKVVDILTTVSGKNRHSYKTVSKSGTPVYRAPEATPEGGQTSRPYDLWSLGCVYLELLVWFLDGYDALKQFREEREGLVSPNTFEDEGFYYTPTEGEPFRLRDVVTEKIDSVSNRTEGHLKTIADMIPQLLKIDPEKRPNAEQLVKKLQNIDNGARPPIEVSHSNHDYTSSTNSLPLPTYTSDSDSDSSFGDMVRVQHPTEE